MHFDSAEPLVWLQEVPRQLTPEHEDLVASSRDEWGKRPLAWTRLLTLDRAGCFFDQTIDDPEQRSATSSLVRSTQSAATDMPMAPTSSNASTREPTATPGFSARSSSSSSARGPRPLPPVTPRHGYDADHNSSRSSRSSQGFRGRRRRFFKDSPPGWSLRYCQLAGIGRESQDDTLPLRDQHQRRGALKALPSPAEFLATLDLPVATETKDKSVFLANRGIDARVAKYQEKESQESRLVSRRNAVVATGHRSGETRKLRLAPKIFAKRCPERYQHLQRVCEEKLNKNLNTSLSKSKDEMKELCFKAGGTEQEVDQLYEIFKQHDFDGDAALDLEEIKSVLADMGLQPQNREEKAEVSDCMAEREAKVGPAGFAFPDFLELVKLVRERLRGLQSMQCMLIFHEADEDHSESLDWGEVMSILDGKLGTLQPRSEEEKQEVHSIFEKCDTDSDGALTFDDFQNFVQRARSKLLTMRRQEEIDLAMEFHLSSSLIREFRVDLPLLYKVFKRYSTGGPQTGVAREYLVALLVELGVAPREAASTVLQIVVDVIQDISKECSSFPGMLNIIREVRGRCKDKLEEELTDRFNEFDRDKSGELGMVEIYQILEEFKMLPRTKEEQFEVGRCIDTFDRDGSGTFELEEFHDFFQRMTEQMRFAERQREYGIALSLGIDDARYASVRRSFIDMKPDLEGNISLIAASQSMTKLRHTLSLGAIVEDELRLLSRKGQEAPNQPVPFIFFLHQVKQCLLDTVIPETNEGEEDGEEGTTSRKGDSKKPREKKNAGHLRQEGKKVLQT
mmetsp:Transcript_26389/g.47570  ORF Transcript_26389/g.47570 Transcript_26389/m.47570 type:complete len:794 (-) Transcript_26389:184-2565(-)